MNADELKTSKVKIYRKTKSNMKKIGTFRPEFDPTVERYAELRVQYDILNETWYDGGCKITESYTNKAGATNQRKTAVYLSLETLRRELTELETLFGLTPKGLKQIKAKGLDTVKGSKLDSVLERLDDG